MITVAALYHFAKVPDPAALQDPLKAMCTDRGVMGSLLLAPEGINGTIAGPRIGVDAVLAHIRSLPGFADLEWKESTASDMPFKRMKVRLKREIVTMGQPDVDPTCAVGRYVDPTDWNEFITSPDVAVIDTRNAYEVAIGTFEGAVIRAPAPLGSFPNGGRTMPIGSTTRRLPCFAPAAFAAKNQPVISSDRGLRRSITLKVGS
jgi:UPF0176 protein